MGDKKKCGKNQHFFLKASLRHLLKLFLELNKPKGLKVGKKSKMDCRLNGLMVDRLDG